MFDCYNYYLTYPTVPADDTVLVNTNPNRQLLILTSDGGCGGIYVFDNQFRSYLWEGVIGSGVAIVLTRQTFGNLLDGPLYGEVGLNTNPIITLDVCYVPEANYWMKRCGIRLVNAVIL